MKLLGLLVRRTFTVIFVMLGAATIVFGVLRLSGDPVYLFAAPDTPPETLDRIRRELGFDAPIYVQYGRYLQELARGNLGQSLRYEQPVVQLLVDRVPATLQLATAGMVIAIVYGVSAGAVAALTRGTVYDQLSIMASLVGQAVPPFWLGIMLILIVASELGLLPTSGMGDFRHIILPAITVGAFSAARISRLTRDALLDVLAEDYLRTARGKGLSERTVLIRHASPNAAIPVVTMISLTFSQLIGGSIVTETVFAWPGLGSLMVRAALVRDYPVVQGAILVIAALVAIITLLTDLLYLVLDPRIRFSRD